MSWTHTFFPISSQLPSPEHHGLWTPLLSQLPTSGLAQPGPRYDSSFAISPKNVPAFDPLTPFLRMYHCLTFLSLGFLHLCRSGASGVLPDAGGYATATGQQHSALRRATVQAVACFSCPSTCFFYLCMYFLSWTRQACCTLGENMGSLHHTVK